MAIKKYIPNELVLDILSRLPAKSLGRFRCVNKLWRDSICDSSFIDMHLSQAIRQDRTNLFLVIEQGRPVTRTNHLVVGDSFDKCVQIQNPFGAHFYILGTCNGLICFGGQNGLIFLFNPCTREYKRIQFQEPLCRCRYQHAYGLGYDGVNQHYMLVEIKVRYPSLTSQATFYSLTNDTTHRLFNTFTLPYDLSSNQDRNGIYFNGFLHWVAFNSAKTLVIISLDNGEEKGFREMLKLPVTMGKSYIYGNHITLGVLQAQLCVFGPSVSVLEGNMELWVVQNYGVSDSLVKLLSVDVRFLPDPSTSRVLCFSENCRLVIKGQKHLLFFDPKQVKTWNITYSAVRQQNIRYWTAYVPTLVQLKSNTYVSMADGVQPSKKKSRLR